jgi:hypothetical protein
MAVFWEEQELITSILISCHKIKAQFASPGLSKNGGSPVDCSRTFPIFSGKMRDEPLKTGELRISYGKSGNVGPDDRIGRITS